MNAKTGGKKIVIHVGPHKTGSTAIQECLGLNKSNLERCGASYIHNSETHRAAMLLIRERYDEAENALRDLASQISSSEFNTAILSQEDFSGDLIGRTMKRQIYPKLTKHLRILSRAMQPHQVIFVAYKRPERDWLRSCYSQSIRYRTNFKRFEDFEAHFGSSFSWEDKFSKPIETFGKNLVVFEYSKNPMAGVENLLAVAGVDIKQLTYPVEDSVNAAPSPHVISLFEHINMVTDFPNTAWFAKDLITKNWSPRTIPAGASNFRSWPPTKRHVGAIALPNLEKRVASRVRSQRQPDLLPPLDADLSLLLTEYVPQDSELPDVTRENMENQSEILCFHLRGKTRLSHLNALTISYLRRATPHTQKARLLFHRIWDEFGTLLINELSTRWLISTLQTYLDHGKSEDQRMIGAVGYFYANMLKIYEGERAIEGHSQSNTYANATPGTRNEFRGLDRFNVGGTDLMLNTNALALEIALRDDVAGLVLQEFLLRTKSAHSAFSRLDATRMSLNLDVPGFSDTWSFFERPKS